MYFVKTVCVCVWPQDPKISIGFLWNRSANRVNINKDLLWLCFFCPSIFLCVSLSVCVRVL